MGGCVGFDLGTLAVFSLAALFFDAVAVMAARPENRGDASFVFAGAIAMAVGFTLAFALAAFVPGSDSYVAVVAITALSVLFACIAANNVRAIFTCRIKIEAEYCGCEEVTTTHGAKLYYPVCAYEFRGKSYCGGSFQSIGARRAQRMAEAGTWPIHLDPQDPAVFITRRSISLGTLVVAVMSVAGFCAALYILVAA